MRKTLVTFLSVGTLTAALTSACFDAASAPTTTTISEVPRYGHGGIGGTVINWDAGAVGILSCESSLQELRSDATITELCEEEIGQCMGDDAVDFGGVAGFGVDPTEFVCNSKTLQIAPVTITAYSYNNVNYSAYNPAAPPTCQVGDSIFVNAIIPIVQNTLAPVTDVGVWLGSTGSSASALTGACDYRSIPTALVDVDSDGCGDMLPDLTLNMRLNQIKLECSGNGSGLVHVATCLGWTQGGLNRACSSSGGTTTRSGTLPGNKNECNCDGFDVRINLIGQ
jgi:hypothetical protein